MRRREQQRAEADKTKQIQKQLNEETLQALGGAGTRSLLGPLGTPNRRSMLGGG